MGALLTLVDSEPDRVRIAGDGWKDIGRPVVADNPEDEDA